MAPDYHQPGPVDPQAGYPLACHAPFEDAAFKARLAARYAAAGLPPDATWEALDEAEGTLPYEVPKRDPAQLPATWEGSVLPALREALDARPETRGCPVNLGGEDLENDRFIAEIVLVDGTRCRTIRRDTAEHVRQHAWQIAFDMADIVHMRRAEVAAPCPVCQAVCGWRARCGTCEAAAREPSPEALPAIATGSQVPAEALRGDTPTGLNAAVARPPEGYDFDGPHSEPCGKRVMVARVTDGDGRIWTHVYSDAMEPRGWLARPEHRPAFDWARGLLA